MNNHGVAWRDTGTHFGVDITIVSDFDFPQSSSALDFPLPEAPEQDDEFALEKVQVNAV
jgi:hypothetical protein